MVRVGYKLWPSHRASYEQPKVQILVVRNGIVDKIIDTSDFDVGDPLKVVVLKQALVDAIHCAKG